MHHQEYNDNVRGPRCNISIQELAGTPGKHTLNAEYTN